MIEVKEEYLGNNLLCKKANCMIENVFSDTILAEDSQGRLCCCNPIRTRSIVCTILRVLEVMDKSTRMSFQNAVLFDAVIKKRHD